MAMLPQACSQRRIEMSNYIEETLGCLRNPFRIAEDGTSQTKRYNTGRVGFHVERLFGISPNNSRSPDFGTTELKVMLAGKKISIGTMPESEFRAINNAVSHDFEKSDPYKKMKNTLVVVYSRLTNNRDPVYQMNGWGLINLETMSPRVKTVLQQDYEFICRYIKTHCNSRDQVTDMIMDEGGISGDYLALSYKGGGRGGYNYPVWTFQAKFMKMLSHA